jgi:hypothetical protein
MHTARFAAEARELSRAPAEKRWGVKLIVNCPPIGVVAKTAASCYIQDEGGGLLQGGRTEWGMRRALRISA